MSKASESVSKYETLPIELMLPPLESQETLAVSAGKSYLQLNFKIKAEIYAIQKMK